MVRRVVPTFAVCAHAFFCEPQHLSESLRIKNRFKTIDKQYYMTYSMYIQYYTPYNIISIKTSQTKKRE